MALKASYEIRCSCGAVFAADVYEYVFVQHDPELQDAILSGDFNRIPCPACGQRLPVEARFLYRDEKTRLWVWVCNRDEEPQKDALIEELIEKRRSMDFHFLDHQDTYRKHVVFGRDGLLELLWAEDKDLKKAEQRSLKANPAFWGIAEGNREPGFIVLSGRRIRVSLPLRLPERRGTRRMSREEKTNWLKHYAEGVNIHNRYSSFLDARSRLKWGRVREREPMDGIVDAFADFAESWASRKVDARRFSAGFPGRRAFLDGLSGLRVSRKLKVLGLRTVPGNARGPR
jgi:hypothetical protein